jgi:hypothetical protein
MMINSCIDGSDSQKKLIDFKKNNKTEQDDSSIGSVSTKYWKNFLARNSDKLELKKAVKYELERDNFVTYANFEEMYDAIEDLLVNDAKIAIKLAEAVWMNEKGEEVSELESVGMKATIKITHPELGITLDEVGGNTNMMNDGHVGGTIHVVAKGSECQIKASKKDKRFTVLGLTCFSGEAVMCVVIIDAKMRDIYAETGIDPNMPHSIVLDDDDELNMLVNNIGPGKMFPGGPTCVYKGKTMPCMVRFNEGGGINGTILKEIFETLDKLEVFHEDRKEGRKPFVLLDGHQSRFDLEFLIYINDPDHEWCFCIGVPYGTALWQVGDSIQQNGQFKLFLTMMKNIILRQRMQTFQCSMGITTHDIIPIINHAWDHSFSKVDTNKKAYCDRGWYPYNRNLLLHEQIRSTMTEASKQREVEKGLFPYERTKKEEEDRKAQHQTASTISPDHCQVISDTIDHEKLQARNGTFGGMLLAELASHEDLLAARKHNMESKKKTEEEKKQAMKNDKKKMTAARLVLRHQTHGLGLPLLDQVKAVRALRQEEANVKKEENTKQYKKMIADGTAVLQKHNNSTVNIKDWNVADITLLLRTYRRKEDKPFPKKKDALLRLFEEWKNRPTTNYNGRVVINLLDDGDDTGTVEEVAEILPVAVGVVSAESEVQVEPDTLDVKLTKMLENGTAVPL